MSIKFLTGSPDSVEEDNERGTVLPTKDETISFLTGFANAVSQGLTFGTADELAGFGAQFFGGDKDKTIKAIRDNLQQFREDSPFIAYGTEIAASIPSAAVGGAALTAARLASPVLKAGIMGAGYGTGAAEGSLPERLPEAVAGGVLGAGLQKVSPVISDRAKQLMGKGVPVTIGQALGGGYKTFEEAMSGIPIAGGVVKSAQQKAVETFNPVVMNEALKPIGKQIPLTVTGSEAFKRAIDAIGDSYKEALGGVGVTFTKTTDELVAKYGSELNPPELKKLKNLIDKQLMPRIENGKLTGEKFKQAQSALRDEAYKASTSSEYYIQDLGSALNGVVFDITSELAKQKPVAAQKLAQADEAYSKIVPVRRAVTKAEATEGVFSPAQLGTAVTQEGRRQATRMARGELAMQPIARTGRQILGKDLPDSGTATRNVAANMALGLAGGTVSGMPLEGALLGAGLSSIYTPLGQQAMRNIAIPYGGATMRSPAVAGLLAQSDMIPSAQASDMPQRITVRPEGSQYLLTD